MHVITLNGKPVTVKNMRITLRHEKGWPSDYIIAQKPSDAKATYEYWMEVEWKERHLGIECLRLKPEDVI